jgi:hypothetical protein
VLSPAGDKVDRDTGDQPTQAPYGGRSAEK